MHLLPPVLENPVFVSLKQLKNENECAGAKAWRGILDERQATLAVLMKEQFCMQQPLGLQSDLLKVNRQLLMPLL